MEIRLGKKRYDLVLNKDLNLYPIRTIDRRVYTLLDIAYVKDNDKWKHIMIHILKWMISLNWR